MRLPAARTMLTACLCAASASPSRAGEVEVLHFWTRGAEVGAVSQLKTRLRQEGHTWRDFAVADGSGGLATVLLKARAKSGNPPTAAQVNGAAIQEWARTGLLSPIDDVAMAEHWNRVLPPVVRKTMQYQGRYVAAPLNIHRVNWLWVNPAALKAAYAPVPTTWDEFFLAAEALQRAGIVPVAHSGQAWMNLGTFESVLIGVGGAELYRRAFVDLDPAALLSPEMEQALATYKRIKQYTGKNGGSRDWVSATAMLVKGEAGMQLMGDWVKAEILAAGKRPGADVLCVPAPGARQSFTYNIDSFVMFNVSRANRPAQRALAQAAMDREFQQVFNLAKGSIPARTDVKLDAFDECAKRSAQDFALAQDKNRLLPSVANMMALNTATVSALVQVINRFWQQDSMTAKEAARQLAEVIRTASDSSAR